MLIKVLDAWTDFWTNVWNAIINFFTVADEQGLTYVARILISIAIIVVAYFVIKLFIALLKKMMRVKPKGPDIDVSAKTFAITVIKIFLWIAVAFIVIGMLKIDTTGLAGITSAITVALGLALQDLIGCFASGVLILQQKYISTGDYISVSNAFGSCEGSVLRIHLFFTYLATPNGQEVIIPNNNMQKAIVTNYTKLGVRRLDYEVGVAYNSDIKKVKAVLEKALFEDPRILKDKECFIYVYELGAYSIGIRFRCWTKFDDYWPFFNEIPERVLIAFNENNIYIPSSTDIHLSENKITR